MKFCIIRALPGLHFGLVVSLDNLAGEILQAQRSRQRRTDSIQVWPQCIRLFLISTLIFYPAFYHYSQLFFQKWAQMEFQKTALDR